VTDRGLIFGIAAALLIGVAVSHAQAVAICLALLVLPALAFRQGTRTHCYAVASAYYLGALWPLAVGARNFFGPQVSVVTATALWVICALLLATPYALLWSAKRDQWLWRVPVALVLGAVPPLGLIGFAWPGMALGLLLPGAGFFAVLGWLLISGLNARHPATIGFLLPWVIVSHALALYLAPVVPSGWTAFNTHFGAISHGSVAPLVEYNTVQEIASEASATNAKVVVFPESVVPRWTAATDALWQSSIDEWQRQGKTVIVGALIPLRLAPGAGRELLQAFPNVASGSSGLSQRRQWREGEPPCPPPSMLSVDPELALWCTSPLGVEAPLPPVVMSYGLRNVAMIRGAQTDAFEQRVPVPFALWKPFADGGARLNIAGRGVVPIAGERAAILICYEQVIPWTALTSAFQRPTIWVGLSNDHWATDTPIGKWQELCIRAWSRLFGNPYLLAVNT
jgi:predicted amidohydrolase